MSLAKESAKFILTQFSSYYDLITQLLEFKDSVVPSKTITTIKKYPLAKLCVLGLAITRQKQDIINEEEKTTLQMFILSLLIISNSYNLLQSFNEFYNTSTPSPQPVLLPPSSQSVSSSIQSSLPTSNNINQDRDFRNLKLKVETLESRVDGMEVYYTEFLKKTVDIVNIISKIFVNINSSGSVDELLKTERLKSDLKTVINDLDAQANSIIRNQRNIPVIRGGNLKKILKFIKTRIYKRSRKSKKSKKSRKIRKSKKSKR